jgi:hypothetical protein
VEARKDKGETAWYCRYTCEAWPFEGVKSGWRMLWSTPLNRGTRVHSSDTTLTGARGPLFALCLFCSRKKQTVMWGHVEACESGATPLRAYS